jgi:hypothetical protein
MTDTRMIHAGQILKGALFSEPMRVETVRAGGQDTFVLGLVGVQSERFRNVIYNPPRSDFGQICFELSTIK